MTQRRIPAETGGGEVTLGQTTGALVGDDNLLAINDTSLGGTREDLFIGYVVNYYADQNYQLTRGTYTPTQTRFTINYGPFGPGFPGAYGTVNNTLADLYVSGFLAAPTTTLDVYYTMSVAPESPYYSDGYYAYGPTYSISGTYNMTTNGTLGFSLLRSTFQNLAVVGSQRVFRDLSGSMELGLRLTDGAGSPLSVEMEYFNPVQTWMKGFASPNIDQPLDLTVS